MAQILDGKIVRDSILNNLKSQISNLKSKPKLVIIQVGDNPESNTYIGQKIKFGEKIGAIAELKKFPADISQESLTSNLLTLNSDPAVHGIIIQIPIPKHLDQDKLIDLINWRKDIDGLSAISLKLLSEGNPAGYIPATTKGVLTLLDHYKIPITGKKVVIIGRSFLVGKPTALAMLNRDATVTICHSKTENLGKETKNADILIVAIGKPNFIGREHVSKNQVVIDVGINVIEKGQALSQAETKEKDLTLIKPRTLVGDVNFDEVSKIVSAITPVPGGVGPMTVASLFENLLEAHKNQNA